MCRPGPFPSHPTGQYIPPRSTPTYLVSRVEIRINLPANAGRSATLLRGPVCFVTSSNMICRQMHPKHEIVACRNTFRSSRPLHDVLSISEERQQFALCHPVHSMRLHLVCKRTQSDLLTRALTLFNTDAHAKPAALEGGMNMVRGTICSCTEVK